MYVPSIHACVRCGQIIYLRPVAESTPTGELMYVHVWVTFFWDRLHLPPIVVAGPRKREAQTRVVYTSVQQGVLQSLVGADSQSETVAGAWPIRRQPIGISRCVVGTLPTGAPCTWFARRNLAPYFPVSPMLNRQIHLDYQGHGARPYFPVETKELRTRRTTL